MNPVSYTHLSVDKTSDAGYVLSLTINYGNKSQAFMAENDIRKALGPVSYTHLDVYKRQHIAFIEKHESRVLQNLALFDTTGA